MKFRQRLPVFAAALWWGSLTATGFLAVPLLFAHLPTPALAGQVASKLFSAQCWVAIGCGLLLLASSRSGHEPAGMNWADGALPFVFGGVLLAMLGEFGVAPRIMARDNLRLWHSVGSALYVLQWACAGVTLWKTSTLSSRT